jgi:hypothetical protein
MHRGRSSSNLTIFGNQIHDNNRWHHRYKRFQDEHQWQYDLRQSIGGIILCYTAGAIDGADCCNLIAGNGTEIKTDRPTPESNNTCVGSQTVTGNMIVNNSKSLWKRHGEHPNNNISNNENGVFIYADFVGQYACFRIRQRVHR